MSLITALVTCGMGAAPTYAQGTDPIPMPAGQYIIYEKGNGLWATAVNNPDQKYYILSNGDDPEISPDGKKIVFVRNDQIHTLNLADGAVTPLTLSDDFVGARDPAWSPNGAQIAFTAKFRTSNFQQIYTIAAAGGTWTQVTGTQPYANEVRPSSCGANTQCAQEYTAASANNYGPSWSPVGDEIAFATDRHYILNPGMGTQVTNREIYRINVSTHAEQRVTMDANVTGVSPFDEYPAWDPSRFGIAFESARTGNREIFIAFADTVNSGNDLTRRTFDPSTDSRVAWSPDGTYLVWARGATATGSDGTILFATSDGSGAENQVDSGNKPSWGTTTVETTTMPLPISGPLPSPVWALPTTSNGSTYITGNSYPLRVTTNNDAVVERVNFYSMAALSRGVPGCQTVYNGYTSQYEWTCAQAIPLASNSTQSTDFTFTPTVNSHYGGYGGDANGPVSFARLNVSISNHSNTGPLAIYLIAPDGSRHLARATNTFTGPGYLSGKFDVSSVRGLPRAGVWKIEIQDNGSGTTGTWNDWGLTLYSEWQLIGSTSSRNANDQWELPWDTGAMHPGPYTLKAEVVATDGSTRSNQIDTFIHATQLQVTAPADPNDKVSTNSFELRAKPTLNPAIVRRMDFYKSEFAGYGMFTVRLPEGSDVPDGGTASGTGTLLSQFGATIGSVQFEAHVFHANAGGLRVSVIAPDGTRVVVFNRDATSKFVSGTGANRTLYLARDSINQQLKAALLGKPIAGDWKIEVEDDGANGVAGKVTTGRLSFTPQLIFLGSDTTPDANGEFSLNWDTSDFVAGKYTITAIARTESEYTAEATSAAEALTFSIKGQITGITGPDLTRLEILTTSPNDPSGVSRNYPSTDTTSPGSYSVDYRKRGKTYTVRPVGSGYAFSPRTRTFTMGGADVTGADFVATADTVAPTSTVTNAYSGGATPVATGTATDNPGGSGAKEVQTFLHRESSYDATTRQTIVSGVWDGTQFSNQSSFIFTSKVDDNGNWSFNLPVLPPGKYYLSTEAVDWASNREPYEIQTITTFYVGNAIAGRVTGSATQHPGVLYLASNFSDMDNPASLPQTSASYDFYDSSRTGFYAFTNVPNGTFYVVPRDGFPGDLYNETFTPANRTVTLDANNSQSLAVNFEAGTGVGPGNDNFERAQEISGNSGTATGSNTGATKESGEPYHYNTTGSKSVWYKWTAPSNGTIAFDTVGSNYDTILAAYTGSAVTALTSLGQNDNFNDGIASRISFAVTAGTTYFIAVDGYTSTGTITLNWNTTVTPVAPPPSPSSATLSIAPNSFGEGAGASAATATLTLNVPTTTAMTFTLASTPAGLTSLPAVGSVQAVTVPANSNSVTFPVGAIDNAFAQGNVPVTITATHGSITTSQGITVIDNDTPGIVVTPPTGLATSEAGGTAAFSVVLASQPFAEVTISLSSSNTSEGTVAPAALTFTPTNWNVPQGVTVTGVNDILADGNQTYTIVTAAAVSTDTNYGGRNAVDVTVVNADNDSRSLTLTLNTNSVVEGGSVIGTVTRNLPATAEMTVALSSTTAAIPVPATMTIPAGQLSAPVTISTMDDAVAQGERSTSITSSALGLSDSKPLTVTDNDPAAITLSISPTSFGENGSAVGTLTRNTPPTGDLEVTVISSNENVASLSSTTPLKTLKVKIPAGQASATFPLKGVVDNLVTTNRSTAISATAGDLSAKPVTVTVTNVDVSPTVTRFTNSGGVAITGARVNSAISIIGTNLSGATVQFGTLDVPVLSGSTATKLNVAVPSTLQPGSVPVKVTNKGVTVLKPFTILVSPTFSLSGTVKTPTGTGEASTIVVAIPVTGTTLGNIQDAVLDYLSTAATATGRPRTAPVNATTGAFTLTGLIAGNYVIAPYKKGTVFRQVAPGTPGYQLKTVSNANLNGVNFGVDVTDTTAPTVTVQQPTNQTFAPTAVLPVAKGSATDNTGGSGVLGIGIALAKVNSASLSSLNVNLYNWNTNSFGPAKTISLPLTASFDPAKLVTPAELKVTTLSGSGWSATLPTSLPVGNYRIIPIAVDKAFNIGYPALTLANLNMGAFKVATPARTVEATLVVSRVALSTAVAKANSSSIELKFAGALEAESASDVGHYTVEVNGRQVTVESAGYNSSARTVSLGLPEGSIRVGDRIVVRWSGVLDTQGATLNGQIGPLSAR